jgi:hypothetical protein
MNIGFSCRNNYGTTHYSCNHSISASLLASNRDTRPFCQELSRAGWVGCCPWCPVPNLVQASVSHSQSLVPWTWASWEDGAGPGMLWDVYDLEMLQVRLGEEILGLDRVESPVLLSLHSKVWSDPLNWVFGHWTGLLQFLWSSHLVDSPGISHWWRSLEFGHYLGGPVPSNPSPTMNRGSSRAVTVPSGFCPPSAESSFTWRSPEENNTVRGSNVLLYEGPKCQGIHGLHAVASSSFLISFFLLLDPSFLFAGPLFSSLFDVTFWAIDEAS